MHITYLVSGRCLCSTTKLYKCLYKKGSQFNSDQTLQGIALQPENECTSCIYVQDTVHSMHLTCLVNGLILFILSCGCFSHQFHAQVDHII